MKIKVTVNLGNYEKITVESSEYEYERECMIEIYSTLIRVGEPRVDDFCKRMFKGLLFKGGIIQ